MPPEIDGLLKSRMGKRKLSEAREIFLGDWLDLFNIKVGEAAEIAGCDQSYISNIISGRKTNINVLYLLRIAEHMDVNVNDFYRRLPSQAQIESMQRLSPKARAAILAQRQKKA